MKVLKSYWAVCLFLSIGLTAMAEAKESAPSIHAFADKRRIFIGDRVRYTITIEHARDTSVSLPRFQSNRIGDFEIKDSGSKTKMGLFGKETTRGWYDITIFSVGRQIIPEAEVRYKQRGAKDWLVKKTQAIDITVESILTRSGGVKDIKDIKGPLYFFELNWFLVLGAAVFILCALSFIIYRRKRKALPAKLPHESALEELESIKAIFSQSGDVKEYYVGISDCVRRYIERAFSAKAPEMTTEEFLNSLKDSAILGFSHKDLLKGFLNACDLVKFAKYAPTRTEIDSVFLTAKKFIEETKR